MNKIKNRIKKDRRSMEQIEYDRLIASLAFLDPDSDEYGEALQRLASMRKLIKDKKKDIPWASIFAFAGTTLACSVSVFQMVRLTQFNEEGNLATGQWFNKMPIPNPFR